MTTESRRLRVLNSGGQPSGPLQAGAVETYGRIKGKRPSDGGPPQDRCQHQLPYVHSKDNF